MKKQNLTASMILNKKFSIELSGYNAKEVDEFLDKILADYRTLNEQIDILENKLKEKADLVSDKDEEIEKSIIKIQDLKTQLKDSQKASQYEILKAIEGLHVKK